jgi:hypothetical protein
LVSGRMISRDGKRWQEMWMVRAALKTSTKCNLELHERNKRVMRTFGVDILENVRFVSIRAL